MGEGTEQRKTTHLGLYALPTPVDMVTMVKSQNRIRCTRSPFADSRDEHLMQATDLIVPAQAKWAPGAELKASIDRIM